MLLIAYSLMFLGVGFGADLFGDGVTTDIDLNTSAIGLNETDGTAGLFSVGVDFTRFFSWVSFSFLVLPSNTPVWFVNVFSIIVIILHVITIMFIFSSLWDG